MHTVIYLYRSNKSIVMRCTYMLYAYIIILVGGIPTPLKNTKVSWDDEIPNVWKNKNIFQTTNQNRSNRLYSYRKIRYWTTGYWGNLRIFKVHVRDIHLLVQVLPKCIDRKTIGSIGQTNGLRLPKDAESFSDAGGRRAKLNHQTKRKPGVS